MTEPLNREYYRLLSDGEAIQSKDEYYDFVERGWTPVPPFPPYAKALPLTLFRRLIEPPKWINVKERAVEAPCWLCYANHTVSHISKIHSATDLVNVTHWMPAPPWPEPPKENEDEAEYYKWLNLHDPHGGTAKQAWFAALEYARKHPVSK